MSENESVQPPTREQIAEAVGAVLFNASNYPRSAMPHMLGQDIGPLRAKVVEAVVSVLQLPTREQIVQVPVALLRRVLVNDDDADAGVAEQEVLALFSQPKEGGN